MKKSFADILSSLDDATSRKLSSKLPGWAAAGCTVPASLNLEQCSSETAALHKASILAAYGGIPFSSPADTAASPVAAAPSPCILADLTGGMGVDSWAFSKVCTKVFYYEQNAVLAEAARDNFARLGVMNIETCCTTVDCTTELPECDWIFIDPARRASDGSGKKVFLLEDCTPDVLTLLPMLWTRTEHIMLKLSPMADITMVAKRLRSRCEEILGRTCLKEIHVVGISGEVKELLCVMDRNWNGEFTITATPVAPLKSAIDEGHLGEEGHLVGEKHLSEAGSTPEPAASAPEFSFSQGEEAIKAPRFCFSQGEEASATASYAAVSEISKPAVPLLLEPDATLLKAGAFKLPCSRFGLKKLDRFTHLYLGGAPVPGLFKTFEIIETAPFDKASIRDLGARYPGADVTTRNLPVSSDALRARLADAARKSSRLVNSPKTSIPGNLPIASRPAGTIAKSTESAIPATRSQHLGGTGSTTSRSQHFGGTDSTTCHIFGVTISGSPLLLVTRRIK